MEDIRIVPTPKQREAKQVADANFFTLYGGAVRGAKTYWLILMAFTYAFKYPKSRFAFVRADLPTLKRNLLTSFNKLVDEFHLRQYIETFNQQDMLMTLTNGSQFLFMSESYDTDKELNRFRGLEVNGFFIDEINEIQEVTFNMLISRAGSWQGSQNCPSKILATCNPSSGWVKKKFYEAWETNTLPSNFAYVPAKITDNPHISKEYIESLKNLPSWEYNLFVEGNWNYPQITGNEFYSSFKLEQNTNNVGYDPELPLHISIDENVNPYITLLVGQVKGKSVQIIDEFCLRPPQNKLDSLCREFAFKYSSHQNGLFIYGDATSQKEDVKQSLGVNLFSILRERLKSFNPVMRVPASNPSVYVRGNFINSIFDSNLFDIEIKINSKCSNTIEDLLNLQKDADGSKKKVKHKDPVTKVSYEKYGHTSDCLDYMICFLFDSEFEAYKKGDRQIEAKIITMAEMPRKNRY